MLNKYEFWQTPKSRFINSMLLPAFVEFTASIFSKSLNTFEIKLALWNSNTYDSWTLKHMLLINIKGGPVYVWNMNVLKR